jgi:CRP-like cAMP-binding protein
MMLRRHARVKLLREVPLFAECSDKELGAVADLTDEVDFAAGDVMMRQGHRGAVFMVIVEGDAEVHTHDGTSKSLGPGDFLGEIALLTGSPHTATVVATGRVRALALSETAFETVLHDAPSVSQKVSLEAFQRLRS